MIIRWKWLMEGFHIDVFFFFKKFRVSMLNRKIQLLNNIRSCLHHWMRIVHFHIPFHRPSIKKKKSRNQIIQKNSWKIFEWFFLFFVWFSTLDFTSAPNDSVVVTKLTRISPLSLHWLATPTGATSPFEFTVNVWSFFAVWKPSQNVTPLISKDPPFQPSYRMRNSPKWVF